MEILGFSAPRIRRFGQDDQPRRRSHLRPEFPACFGACQKWGGFPGNSWIKLFPRVLNDETASVRSVDVTDAVTVRAY
jgi:hypothetical protein